MHRLNSAARDKLTHRKGTEKYRLKHKYETLVTQEDRPIVKECVKNISSKTLTIDEERVLSKGLNFNPGHTKKDVLSFIAGVESEIDNNTNIA